MSLVIKGNFIFFLNVFFSSRNSRIVFLFEQIRTYKETVKVFNESYSNHKIFRIAVTKVEEKFQCTVCVLENKKPGHPNIYEVTQEIILAEISLNSQQLHLTMIYLGSLVKKYIKNISFIHIRLN